MTPDPRMELSSTLASASESAWNILCGSQLSVDDFLLLATVFWPRLIEVGEFIFIEENYDAEYFDRLQREVSAENMEETINTLTFIILSAISRNFPAKRGWNSSGISLSIPGWIGRDACFRDAGFAQCFPGIRNRRTIRVLHFTNYANNLRRRRDRVSGPYLLLLPSQLQSFRRS